MKRDSWLWAGLPLIGMILGVAATILLYESRVIPESPAAPPAAPAADETDARWQPSWDVEAEKAEIEFIACVIRNVKDAFGEDQKDDMLKAGPFPALRRQVEAGDFGEDATPGQKWIRMGVAYGCWDMPEEMKESAQ